MARALFRGLLGDVVPEQNPPNTAGPEADDRVAELQEKRRNKGGRKAAIVTLLVIACILAPIAGASIWVKNQVTDTSRYVRTVKPLASNSAIQAAVGTTVTDGLFARVDINARAKQALPPRAKPFAGALATGLHNFTENQVRRFVASPAFEKLWVQLNKRAHEQLVKILTGQGHYVQTAHGEVAIDLAPVVAKVKQRLDERGVTFFDRVQTSTFKSKFVVLDSKQLDNGQKAFRLLKALAIALPLIVLALFAAAIAVSRRRRRTLLQASLGLAFSMAVLGALLTIGRSIYLDKVAGPTLPHDAAAAFYDTIFHYLRLGLRVIAGVALVVAAGAFFSGPSHVAVAVRRWFGSALGWGQGQTGVTSSAVGRWVRTAKRPLRIAAILLPVLIFLFWDTPTVSLVIALVALALFLLLVIEFFGRAPPEPASHVPTPTP